MASSTPARGMSVESKEQVTDESPYTSEAPFLHDIEKQDERQREQIQAYDLGGPLEISPSHLTQPASPFIPNAFTALITLVVPCIFLHPRKIAFTPATRRKIIDFTGFKSLPFTLFSLASFIGFIGLYIPFFYISTFASTKAGLNSTFSFYMLPILSAGSILGRIAPSFIANFVGPLNVLSICTLIAGFLGFCWIAIPSSATAGGFIIWSLLYRAFSGAFVSLQPSTVVSITDDMSIVGGRLGMNTFCAALGLLIGTPIAGLLLEKDPSWIALEIFCGATLLLGGGLVFITRVGRVGFRISEKA